MTDADARGEGSNPAASDPAAIESKAAATIPLRDKIWDGVFITFLATAVGPPVAGFLLGVGVFLMVLAGILWSRIAGDKPIPLGFLGGAAAMPFLFGFYSFLVGAVPAFLSGLAISVHAARANRLTLTMCVFHTGWVGVSLAAIVLTVEGGYADPLGSWTCSGDCCGQCRSELSGLPQVCDINDGGEGATEGGKPMKAMKTGSPEFSGGVLLAWPACWAPPAPLRRRA